MSRIEDAKKMWTGWKSRLDDLQDTDEKVTMVAITLAVVGLTLLFVLFLVWAVLSFIQTFWWTILIAVGVWYFWPSIKDFVKKGQR